MEAITDFYGVYLLYCLNPKYKGRTYIGYTTDPNRRIKQHNKGKKYGGAHRTSQRGPWSMALIVHNFPNNIAALRFEWAWQHPLTSRRLRHVTAKRAKETGYEYRLRVLSEMLLVGPWSRLPLTIRWLNPDLVKQFPEDRRPPIHMPICYGAIISRKLDKLQLNKENTVKICDICNQLIVDNHILTCLNVNCNMKCHLICLGDLFLVNCRTECIPIEGNCPKCDENLLWGDLIRQFKGCFNTIDLIINDDLMCSSD